MQYQIITAGYFATESFTTSPSWSDELKMYTTSAISPPFIVHALSRASMLKSGSKIILVSSESGSITLRHESEGGGNYGHHASKAALNMVGKLLSLDLKEKGVVVSVVHPGFMRTEMTKGVGFDKFWDDGGGEFIAFRWILNEVLIPRYRSSVSWEVDGQGIERLDGRNGRLTRNSRHA